jgi:hypothetical protein
LQKHLGALTIWLDLIHFSARSYPWHPAQKI